MPQRGLTRPRVEEHDFGTVTEHDIGGRLVRVYRGRPGQTTGRFYRERSIFTLFIRGEIYKASSSESAFLQGGALGLLKYVDVDQIKVSDRGAIWMNVELGSQLSERANQLFADARMDCIRSYDPTVVAIAVRLLKLLDFSDDTFRWDQEELLGRIVNRLLVESASFPRARVAGELRDLIEAHYGSTMTLADACARIGCNMSHASRAFKHRFGCSPGEYLRSVRFARAFQLIMNSDAPLIHVATECGFSDESHLCRIFKHYSALTPTISRKLCANLN